MSSRFRLAAIVFAVLTTTAIALVAATWFLLPIHADPHIDAVEAAAADGQFAGMTPQQVGSWLGGVPSDYKRSGWDVTYRLGDERGFMSIDSEWLVLRLDEDGRVVEAEVVAD